MLSCLTGKYGPRAKLNGSNLVLTMPDAAIPTVWNLDMDSIQTANLRMEMDDQAQFMVLFDKGDQDGADILATYPRRGPAIRAMMRASKAMERYRKASDNTKAQKSKGWGKKLLMIALALFVLWLALSWLLSLFTPSPSMEQELRAMLQQQESTTQIPQLAPRIDPNSNGVPIPLEDFLNRPEQGMP